MDASQQNRLTITNTVPNGSASGLAPAVTRLPFIASPMGMMLMIPLIVAVAAGGAVWLYESTVSQGINQQAAQRFPAQAQILKGRTEATLAEAGDAVNGMASWFAAVPDLRDRRSVERALTAIIGGRPGIMQAYLGLPDGGLVGIMQGVDGSWRFKEVVPSGDGTARRTVGIVHSDGSLTAATVETGVTYDARTRPWFRQAVASPGLEWTDPYVFAQTGMPGITCARALPDPDPARPARAVVAVDLDLGSLGNALERKGDLAQHVLFTGDHTVVALPAAWAASLSKGSLARLEDLAPREDGFATHLPTLPGGEGPAVFHWSNAGQTFSGLIQPLSVPAGPRWYLGQVVNRREVLGTIDDARDRALWGAFGAVGVGIAAGIFFARLLSRSRAETEHQRLRARAAEAKAKELGSYQLIKKLGEGGMGQVWLAEHRLLARPAAVKLISPNVLGASSDQEEARRRFDQEARITASLRSRNTVELYDYGVSPDGTFFYVMELLEGMDLRDLITNHGPLPVGRAKKLLTQVLLSLAEAHDRGLVHRDIKPENIFTCRRADEVDVIKVLDFGLVRVKKSDGSRVQLTMAGYIQGTPTTMSPEQIEDKELDGRSDLYSVGCVACWLLTGTEVFSGDSPMGILTKHLNEAPLSVGSRGRILPPDLVEMIDKCLCKNRDHRWNDVRALMHALETVAEVESETWTDGQARTWWNAHKPPQAPGPVSPEAATRALSPRARTVGTARVESLGDAPESNRLDSAGIKLV